MPDMYFDVDTAITECPVNLMPLIDDTDFKSIEGAVAYDAAGMALFWHFVTSAGAYTLTAVTPTTGGNYDWTDQGAAGVYTIEIPASGGASINNDTEGYGWFTGVATGILPWRGPVIGFRAAALNDSLCDSGTTLATPTNITAGVITTVTNLTNAPTNGDLTATMKTSVTTAATAATPIAASVTGAVGSVTGNVGGNVTGSVGSVTGAVGSVTGLTASDVGAIKTKTDSLTFTVAGYVAADIRYVIGDPVKINSTKATNWGGT